MNIFIIQKFLDYSIPKEKKEKSCKEWLICPYNHEDCGKDGNKIILDKKLITDCYKSLMANYEN